MGSDLSGQTRLTSRSIDFRFARILLSGIELAHMIAKGQMDDRSIGSTRAEQFYSLHGQRRGRTICEANSHRSRTETGYKESQSDVGDGPE
jgi:hypothetical protein